MTELLAVFAAIQAHWPTVVAVATALSSLIATLSTLATDYPKVETVLHDIQGLLSFVEHANVGGWKWPFTKLQRPPMPKSQPPVSLK